MRLCFIRHSRSALGLRLSTGSVTLGKDILACADTTTIFREVKMHNSERPYDYFHVELNGKYYSVKIYPNDDWYRGMIDIETSWEINHPADRYLVCPRTITRYKRIDSTGRLGKKILAQVQKQKQKAT